MIFFTNNEGKWEGTQPYNYYLKKDIHWHVCLLFVAFNLYMDTITKKDIVYIQTDCIIERVA